MDENEVFARAQQELTARLTDYCTRFGPQGQGWALSNRPLPDCYQDLVSQLREQHAAELTAQQAAHASQVAELQAKLDAQVTKVTELTDRLDSLALGEKTPVSTGPGDPNALTPEEQKELGASLPPRLAAFVAAQRRAKAAK
jgi:hypothetical protein